MFYAAEQTAEHAPESDDEGDFLTLATASRQASLRTKAACKQLATHLLSVRVLAVGLGSFFTDFKCYAVTLRVVVAAH